MNLSTWAIQKPIPSVFLFAVLTIAGIGSFLRLGVSTIPDVDFPVVVVVAQLPGSAPQQLENEVTRKIEASVASIGLVKHVTSVVVDGVSSTSIQFELEKSIQVAVNEVRDAMTRIRSDLPSDLREPLVSHVNKSGGATVTYAVSAVGMDETDLSWFVDDTIGKNLLPIPGVARVTRHGGVTREVSVELNPVKLQAMKLTAGEVSRQLRAVQQEAPGGRGTLGDQEQSVRTSGTVTSAAQLSALTIPIPGGTRLRLDEVATIRDTTAERRQIALLDGKPIISFEVFRAKGFDDIGVGKRVRAALAKLQEGNPNVKLVEISNITDNVERNYESSMDALYEGAFLAIIVVWLFLRDWRATLVSAVALPLSIIPTFAVMEMLGYSLNSVTLLALTLMIGVLVDDAIVEVENIMRHLRGGAPPIQAATIASTEIGLAVIATSLALVAVFLPTAFLHGIFGLYFRQFGWTASVAVLASLLVARMLTPMMSAYLLKPSKHVEHDGPTTRRYLRTVRWCLAHPAVTCGLAFAFFAVSIGAAAVLPTTSFEAADDSRVTVTVRSAPGTTFAQSLSTAEQARRLLQGIPELKLVYTTIGAGTSTDSMDGGDNQSAILQIELTSPAERKRTQSGIEREVRDRLAVLPGVRVSVGTLDGNADTLEIQLAADDPELLDQTAQAVERELRTLRNVGNVISTASLLRPEITIRPDFAKAARQGITVSAIGEAVRIATAGDYDAALPKLNLPNRQLYIRVHLDPASRADLNTIRQLRLRGTQGMVPLENVAEVVVEGSPSEINRFDRSRSVKLTIELQGRPLGDVMREASKLPTLSQLPRGVRQPTSFNAEIVENLLGDFGIVMLISMGCVYGVLVLLFHDFVQPITILAALPLAAGGALGTLILLGASLSVATVIGLLMLMGIVSKNSILLVEYIIMARRDLGLSRRDAILEACQKRARPILMTTVAMIAGMLPMALGLHAGSNFGQPMAMTVIGGLISSTFLSLLVVPVVYEVLDEAKHKLRGWLGLARQDLPGQAQAEAVTAAAMSPGA